MYSDPFGWCPPADENYADCEPGPLARGLRFLQATESRRSGELLYWDLEIKRYVYSSLSALIGLTLVARSAGNHEASKAAAASKMAAIA